MITIETVANKRWCQECRKNIPKGVECFREYYSVRRGERYNQWCIVCGVKEIIDRIEDYKKLIKQFKFVKKENTE